MWGSLQRLMELPQTLLTQGTLRSQSETLLPLCLNAASEINMSSHVVLCHQLLSLAREHLFVLLVPPVYNYYDISLQSNEYCPGAQSLFMVSEASGRKQISQMMMQVWLDRKQIKISRNSNRILSIVLPFLIIIRTVFKCIVICL